MASKPPPARDLTIGLRKGVRVGARLLLPAGDGPFPAVLVQTPYGRATLPDVLFHGWRGVAVVVAEWRQPNGPPGPDMVERARDGFDLVGWTSAQPWCDGRVGTWGPSALAAIQFRTAAARPPALRCGLALMAGLGFAYETFYPGGVLRQEYVDRLEELGFGLRDVVAAHPTKDAFWRLDTGPDPAAVHAPFLLVGGWYDVHAQAVVDAYRRLTSEGPPAVAARHRLLVGPWTHHATWSDRQGELVFDGAAAALRDATCAWWRRRLRDEEPPGPDPAVRYWQMGRGRLHGASGWPPAGFGPRTLHLRADGTVGPEPGASGLRSFDHDPGRPVPTVGGANLDPHRKSGPRDLRETVEGHPGALVYTSAPLEEPLETAGAPELRLRVAATSSDAHVAARLSDVRPDGRSLIVGDAMLRLALAEDRGAVRPLRPGETRRVTVRFPPVAMTWRPGHRLRVVLSGSNHPRFAVAPETCRLTVRHGPGAPAALELSARPG